MKLEKWLETHTESLTGKVVAITGSTGGLGRELTRYLVSLGASLVLLDRNAERSEALRQSLLEEFPEAEIRCIGVDLAQMASVRRAVDQLLAVEIDVFLHNAGAYKIPRSLCDTGWENVFQINFVSPYYMIRRLMPRLRARGGRVVVVGSIAYRYSKSDGTDVDFRNRRMASVVYGNAKRYLMVSLYELFRRETAVSLSVTHPGITLTNITAHYPKVIFALIKNPMKVIFMSPRRACLSVLRGVFEPCVAYEWIGPRCFDIWGLPQRKRLRGVSAEERRRIGETAECIYGGIASYDETVE